MDQEDDDDGYRIGPINGHTPWEPGAGCLWVIVLLVVLVAVAISGGHH